MMQLSAEHRDWLARQGMTPAHYERERALRVSLTRPLAPEQDSPPAPEREEGDTAPPPYNRVAVIYAFDPDIREHALDRWEALRAMREELADPNAVGMSIRIVANDHPLGDLWPDGEDEEEA